MTLLKGLPKKIWQIFPREKKKLLFVLFFLAAFLPFIETFNIGWVALLVNVATDYEKIYSNKYLYYLYRFFEFERPDLFVIVLGYFLIVFGLLRSAFVMLYHYLLASFLFGNYIILAFRVLKRYLNIAYKDFVQLNSSYLTKNIINEAFMTARIMSNLLHICSELLVAVFIYLFMCWMNFKVTFLITGFLGLNILVCVKISRIRIEKEGINREKTQGRIYQIINAALSNFKFLKLRGVEEPILDNFYNQAEGFAFANIRSSIWLQVPRIFMEAIGIIALILLVLFSVWKYHILNSWALTLLSVYILGFYRLLPALNRILVAYNQIAFDKKALDIIYNIFYHYKIENLGESFIEFNEVIRLENISFSYGNYLVLDKINLSIKKGERVAFIGETGSGKSTLIDIIVGFYRPNEGKIFVDDQELNDNNLRAWRKKVGYVPQHVYLFDGTVAENIALGKPVKKEKIVACLKLAKIWDCFKKREGINTRLGENGLMLSGGQKQRIAIARAFYDDPEVLVLDEATNALDYSTEEEVMAEIYNYLEKNSLTLIIVAHRNSLLKYVDKVYLLKNKKCFLVNKDSC